MNIDCRNSRVEHVLSYDNRRIVETLVHEKTKERFHVVRAEVRRHPFESHGNAFATFPRIDADRRRSDGATKFVDIGQESLR